MTDTADTIRRAQQIEYELLEQPHALKEACLRIARLQDLNAALTMADRPVKGPDWITEGGPPTRREG